MPVDVAGAVDARELAKVRRVHPHVRNRDAFERIFGETCQLQDSQRFVVERDRTRRHEDVGGFVDDERSHAVNAEQIRDRGAHRAEADDQHIGLLVCHANPPLSISMAAHISHN